MDNAKFLSAKMRRVEQIHFIGIGGAGMSGIAEVLHNQGYRITGSDIHPSRTIERLQMLGINVHIGHLSENITGADVVVRSSAVDSNNPEVTAAKAHLIPIIPRAAMLAELMRFRYGIAIAGTHGKTTTTSLVSSLLAEGGLDPSFVIGGKLNSCGANAQLGKSPYFVVEADESDASFLFLKPMMAVVTNIDADHMATYENNFNKLRDTFIEFLHHLPFYGLAVLCIDDPEVFNILPAMQRPIQTYGFNANAHYRAYEWIQNKLISEFKVQRPKPHKELNVQLPCPGRHNVLNALAAIIIATELGINDTAIINGLFKFQGVGRRFQLLGEKHFKHGCAIIIDDYGHHPQEIIATVNAIRQVWPQKNLIHIFQPHRYSRTKSLFNQFVNALMLAEQLLLMDIYAAGEDPLPEVTSSTLVQEIKKQRPMAKLVNEQDLQQTLDEIVTGDYIILMQGAGNIGQLALNLIGTKQAKYCE